MADLADQILYGGTPSRGDDGFLDKEVTAAVEALGDLDAWSEHVYKRPYGFEVGKMLAKIRDLSADQLDAWARVDTGADAAAWEQATLAIWEASKLNPARTAAIEAVQHLVPEQVDGRRTRLVSVFRIQEAILAVISREQISEEQFDLLYRGWRSIFDVSGS